MDPPDLGTQSIGSVLTVTLLLTTSVGGSFGAFFHGGPLLYYDARPAYVTDAGLSSSGYQSVNATDTNLSFSPLPLISIQTRTWVSVYSKGLGTAGKSEAGGGQRSGDGPATNESGFANASAAAVFSMSALQVGPISANPLVYASDPRVLSASGVLLEHAERHLPQNVTNVTNVSVRSDRQVTVLGQETEMTTFDGSLETSNETTIDVRIYLVRAVRNGELVVVFGIAPASAEGAGDSFATLAENVRMVEWGRGHPQAKSSVISPAVTR